MEKVCEVCGDGSEGFAHLIATCIRCLSTHEHAYCMRNHVAGVFPESWICESCDTAEAKAAGCIPRGRRTKSSWQFHSRKQKPVKGGKVKFIAQDEVIRLASGASKSTATSVHRKCFTERVQETTSSATRLKRLTDNFLYSSETPTHLGNSEGAGSSSQQLPVPHDITACGSTSDGSNVQLQNRRDVKHIVGLYGPYLPANDATWKGGFSVVENGTECEIFEGFQAQPPSKIGRKAYELSKAMPPILQLKMLPREQSFAEHFEDSCVDLHHIGMYLFPCEDNVESSRHSELVHRMEQEEAVMVGSVKGVELMICSSKYLKMDVQRKEFLWGIFCGRRKCVEEEVAMEIDMVGGEDVGTLDVVVHSRDRAEGSQVITALKRLRQLSSEFTGDCPPGFSVKRETDDSDESVRSKVIKTEPH